MSFFDPPKFPEPFKPEPLWQMNTCPDCPNDLVCHDQGECLRPTPETDALQYRVGDSNHFAVHAFHARLLERERNEAREQLASEKSTRNAIIAKGLETERQLFEARAICEELVTDSNAVTLAATVVRLERERNEAREAFAIATDQLVQVQGELRQARELVARLRQDLDDPPADVQERVLAKLRSAYANLNTLP